MQAYDLSLSYIPNLRTRVSMPNHVKPESAHMYNLCASTGRWKARTGEFSEPRGPGSLVYVVTNDEWSHLKQDGRWGQHLKLSSTFSRVLWHKCLHKHTTHTELYIQNLKKHVYACVRTLFLSLTAHITPSDQPWLFTRDPKIKVLTFLIEEGV